MPHSDSNHHRSWLLVVAVALFPFVLRVGLDLEAVQRQSVLSVYRVWRWSPAVQGIRSGSPVIFERQREKSKFEDAFQAQLQQDFRLVEVGEHPRVRVYFEPDDFLHARVEVLPAAGQEWRSWESKARFVNNGILLGAWAGLALWILGRSLAVASVVSLVMMLLWAVDWNLLELPAFILVRGHEIARELSARFTAVDWNASELGRLADVGALTWLALAALAYPLARRWMTQRKMARNLAIFSFALEPLILWGASHLGNWGGGALWWKVYLGSFGFRFVGLAVVFLGLLKPRSLAFRPDVNDPSSLALSRKSESHRIPFWALLVPLVFVMAGGWSWLNVVISPATGETLLRLKVYFVAFILAFVLGSRIFSLAIGTLALAILLPPTRGHAVAAAWYGLAWDALLLGWWVSPFKGMLPNLPSDEKPLRFLTVVTMAWVVGVFLSSVGAPLGIAWAALMLAVWAYAQLSPDTSGDSEAS